MPNIVNRDKFGRTVKNTNFLSFKDAREFVRALNIKTCKEWQSYTKLFSYNSNLPKAPDFYYKEWTNWYDFLGRSRDHRVFKVNDDYFKTWSYDMAYILGFWFADGFMRETDRGSYIFSIKQHVNDRYALEQILDILESNYPIRTEMNSCNFEINSKEIYNDIIKLGGKERKSLDVKFPSVPTQYLPDFIRGYFDGDGTISKGRQSVRTKKYCGYKSAICSGSKVFIDGLRKILKENIKNISINYYEHKTKGGAVYIKGRCLLNDGICYYLHFSPNNTRKLRDFMYSTPSKLKLIRKYNEFVDAGEYRQCVRDIEYLPFKEAKELVSGKNFINAKEYHIWIKSKYCNVILPATPGVVYSDWKGWSDFLGHYRLPYKELSNLAIQNKITGKRHYYKWIKTVRGNTRGRYPRHPALAYKEWISWDDFLGRNEKKYV